MESPLISIVIPTYREEDYIQRCLISLTKQSVYDRMEVIISDFDDGTRLTERAVNSLGFERVRYLKCPRMGIAFQRNFGVEHSIGKYLINLDADTYFRDLDSIERLVQPIEAGLALLTHCSVKLEDHPDVDILNPQRMVWDTVIKSQLFLPIAQASGLTTTREVFDRIGGFMDVQGEDWYFTAMFTYHYGIDWKIMLPDVVVYTSPRRYAKQPLHRMLDYTRGFRGDKTHQT